MKKKLDKNLILVGVINSAHGIRGDVVVRCFTMSPEDLFKRTIFDELGNILDVRKMGAIKKENVICRLNDCADRNHAEKLKGTQLFCNREDLPEIDTLEEFYIHDIKNLVVKDENEKEVGIVNDVLNYGAGDIIEVKFNDGQLLMFPFTKECFPLIEKDYVQINLKDFIGLVK